MNNSTYKAILTAKERAERVIGIRKDLRMMERSLKDEEAELDSDMNVLNGHLVGEGLGDLEGTWDHLVDQGRWDIAVHVAALARDTTEDHVGWSYRVKEAQRRILE